MTSHERQEYRTRVSPRVLNDHPSLHAETKKCVLDVMVQLDYHPNLAARTLVTSRTRTISGLSSQHL